MTWRLNYIIVAALCLNGYIFATVKANVKIDHPYREGTSWEAQKPATSDIEFDKEPIEGSGVAFSDDEDFGESGSGSGSGMDMGEPEVPGVTKVKTTIATSTTTMMPTTSTTTRPPTACEKMRQASRQMVGKFVPRCLPNGDFDSLQCHGHPGTADCWCSDLEGREIPGTLMETPNFPNCDEGLNLPPCVHQLVKHVRSKLLGSFRPKCTVDGQFDRVQCHGSMCFCVDEGTGQKVTATEVVIPDVPNCDDDPVESEVTSKKLLPDSEENKTVPPTIDIDDGKDMEIVFPESPTNTISIDTDHNLDQSGNVDEKNQRPDDGMDPTSKFKNENIANTEPETSGIGNPGREGHHKGKQVEKASEIMTQPGILAGIIGGSVVLLLCLVLLVMFIIYRMRKKDEGSYPLDEPRKTPNYNYVRAPEKEFYA